MLFTKGQSPAWASAALTQCVAAHLLNNSHTKRQNPLCSSVSLISAPDKFLEQLGRRFLSRAGLNSNNILSWLWCWWRQKSNLWRSTPAEGQIFRKGSFATQSSFQICISPMKWKRFCSILSDQNGNKDILHIVAVGIGVKSGSNRRDQAKQWESA